MQFSLFHLFTDRRKVIVLKSLKRDFDLTRKIICFVDKEKYNGLQLHAIEWKQIIRQKPHKNKDYVVEDRFSKKT